MNYGLYLLLSSPQKVDIITHSQAVCPESFTLSRYMLVHFYFSHKLSRPDVNQFVSAQIPQSSFDAPQCSQWQILWSIYYTKIMQAFSKKYPLSFFSQNLYPLQLMVNSTQTYSTPFCFDAFICINECTEMQCTPLRMMIKLSIYSACFIL